MSFGWFVEGLNEEFGDEVQIEWIGGPEVVPPFELHEAVRSGVIDMAIDSCSYYVSLLSVSDAPMLSNLTHEEIRDTGFFDIHAELHKEVGLIYLGELSYGRPFHIFVNEKVETPWDLAGKKIRVFPAITPVVDALHAIPVMMAMPEIYTAMERGVVDGFAMTTIGFVKAWNWHEVTKYMIMPGWYRGSCSVLVNPDTWNRLPKEVQDGIRDWKTNVLEPRVTKEYTQEFGEAQTQAVIDAGVEVIEFSPADTAAYLKLAYDAAWAKKIEKAPDIAPKLKDMVVK